MIELIISIFYQAIPFLPIALAVYISFNLLNATDMTLDGSFVTGAGIFAHCITLHISPIISTLIAISCGAIIGIMVATFQRRQRIDPLLAGVLAIFILTSLNLILMGRPNINLLGETTLLSHAFAKGEIYGYALAALYVSLICLSVILLLQSRIGLNLRAFGDNPAQMTRYGFNIEKYRLMGFALTNSLAAFAGCLTAQTVSYADINMGFGITLTALGAIILGQEILTSTLKRSYLRPLLEFLACLLGVSIYFTAINTLLRMQVDPLYLKIILGLILVFFLRTNSRTKTI